MPIENVPLSALVAEAYGKLGGENTADNSAASEKDPVAAAFSEIAAEAEPKSPPDKTSQAYAQVPSSKALERFDQLEAARGNTAGAFAGITPRNVVFLMSTQSLPPKGMWSALQPSALGPGQFSLLQDVRIDDKSIRARQPTTDRSATGLPGTSGSCRGIWSGRLNGTVYVVGAWLNGTQVGIYVSTNGTAFSEATATSGAFGNSRMTDAGLPFAFQVVNNIVDGLDYLTIQNGTDAPRVYGTALFRGAYVRVITQYAAPLWALSTKAQGVFSATFSSNLAAVSDTGADPIVPTLNGTGPDQSVSLAFPTTITSGATVLLDFGASGLDMSVCGNQLVFVSDQAIQNAWNFWKVECSTSTGGPWTAIADPTSSTYNAPVRVPFVNTAFGLTSSTGGLNGEELVAFNLTALTPSSVAAQRYLRLTWEGPTAISAAFTSTVHGIFGSGAQLAYQQTYAVSTSGLNGMSESPGVVLAGWQANASTIIPSLRGYGIFVPYSAGIYYDHQIPTQVQSLTDLQNGCDTINLYRMDQGSTDFFFFSSTAIGAYPSGAWVYTGTGTTTPPVPPAMISVTYSAYNSTALNVSRYVPDAYAMVMPLGICLASANGRTWVGGQAFYAVSEYGQAFRFRPALEFVNGAPLERSATYVTIAGQTISAFATPSGSALNSQTVFFWTQTRTYAVGGFDGYSLSRPAVCFEIGCTAPGSVAQYKDAIFWLDDNKQIRRFNYGRSFLYGYSNANAYDLAPAISRMVVDDQTNAIPVGYLPWVKGVATFDRYYFFYPTSSGTTNTLALVFEENLQAFVQDSLSAGAQSACVADLSTGRALLLGGADGAVYTHEDPSSSATHTVAVTCGELSAQMWRPQFYGRVGVAIDSQSGQTLTITNSIKPNGQADSSTVDLHTVPVNQTTANQQWRWGSRTETSPPGVDGETTTQPGLYGLSAQVALSLTMTPGTHIYCLAVETAPALAGADQL